MKNKILLIIGIILTLSFFSVMIAGICCDNKILVDIGILGLIGIYGISLLPRMYLESITHQHEDKGE